MNQVLSNVGFLHHIGTKILCSIHHGLKQHLQWRGGPGEDAVQEAPPQNPPEGVRGAEPWENGDTTGSWGATNGSELLPGAV